MKALFAAAAAFLLTCPVPADEFDALREDFLRHLNSERARRGSPPLRASTPLGKLAQALADEAARRGDSAIPERRRGEILERAQESGYSPKSLAEIFTRADGSVGDVVAFWRERGGSTWKNLLGSEFRDLGVGAATLGDAPLYVFLVGLSWDEYAAGRAEEYRDLPEMRRRMLARVNAERARERLPVLVPSHSLDRVAQAHAEDMLRRSYYGHKSPDGETVRERALAGGYRLRFVGENIASGQSSVEEVMDGWMASAEHRPNILSKVYSEAGFGLAIGKNRGGFQIIWVQVFGRPRGVRPSF